MQYMKLSTSRDFRINAATLETALQEQDDPPDVSPRSYTETKTSTLSSFGSMCCPFFPSQSLRRQRRHQSPNRRRENTRIQKGEQGVSRSYGRSIFRALPSSVQRAVGEVEDLVNVQGLACEMVRHTFIIRCINNLIIIHFVDKLLKELHSCFNLLLFVLFKVIKDAICSTIHSC